MFNANHTINIWWRLTKRLRLNHNSNWIAADKRDIANLSGGRCNLSSGFSPFSARTSLATARETKHNPYRLLPANLTATLTSKSLKTFVSRTHIRDVCSLPVCAGKIADGKFIIERSVAPLLIYVFDLRKLCFMYFNAIARNRFSSGSFLREKMQQATSIHRTS